MFSDRVFQIAFLVSLLAHSIVFLQSSNLDFLPKNKTPRKLEISYVKLPELKIEELKKKSAREKKEEFLKIPQKITAKKMPPPPFADRENILKKSGKIVLSEANLPKPALKRPDVIAIKKKITLPPVDMKKMNNTSYISYYQIVREKIRRTAYRNYTRTEIGEVYLSFIVSADGYLKDVRLAEDRSSANPYLRNIALRSIEEASPFPGFPKELDYPQLSFNVIISFEIE